MAEKREMTSHNDTILVFALLILSLLFLYFTPSMLPSLGSGAITGYATSQVGNLSAGVATFIACTWSNPSLAVSFGSSLNPGNNDTNATQNYAGTSTATFYNVTVDTLSNTNVNITIKGETFISGANKIEIGNVTWSSNVTVSNATLMSPENGVILTSSFNTIQPLGFNIGEGNTVWYRFWMDIPTTAVAGSYLGNYTQQCVAST